jgi:crotonobetainyl-CoA:carnitine CoA-transferase CaiB-like acyl-CoA transferase
MTEPLTGIRVVEVGSGLQGPAAGGLLADLGAEVFKVEPPEGDASRFHRGVNNFLPAGTPGAQFIASARGKKSLCLDIHNPIGKEVVYRLVERSDIFLSNYREDALERMGLGYEALRGRNPVIIYGVASGFGPKGPDAAKGMVDGAAQARGGLVAITGDAGGPPMMPGSILADLSGAMQLTLGLMTALLVRQRWGIGQRVATSSYGSQIWLQMWEITQSSLTGRPLTRSGSHHPNVPGPYGTYQTADGRSLFFGGARTEDAWRSFCEFGGIPEAANDPRWDSHAKRNRVDNSSEGPAVRLIVDLVQRAFASRPFYEWMTFFDSQPEILQSAVVDYAEVLEDPQALANEYIIDRNVPLAGRRKVVGQPIHFSETPGVPKEGIPELGAHTELVMSDLGFKWEEIEALNELTRNAVRQKFIDLGLEPPY